MGNGKIYMWARNEGRLISMQLNELVRYVEEDEILLIRDYCETYMDIMKFMIKYNQCHQKSW